MVRKRRTVAARKGSPVPQQEEGPARAGWPGPEGTFGAP